jgi:apolipoprotein N-acyltransferase
MQRAAGRAAGPLALGAGVLQAFSIAAPWNGQPLWWLQILSLAVLAWLLSSQPTARRGALVGWLFAIAWLATTWWWLFISMHVYGGLAAPLAVAAVLALAGFLALYYAVVSGLYVAAARMGTAWAAIVFGALWLAAELARGVWFTGFPWGAGGYAHVEGPLAPLAPWVGVYGVGFVAAVLACALFLLIRGEGWRSLRVWVPAGVVALAVAVAHAVPAGAIAPAGAPFSVALLQGNIPQDEKFESGSGVPLALGWYASQLQAATATLVVAPETAIPLLPAQLPEDYLPAVSERYRAPGSTQAMLVGIPLGNLREGFSNSVIGIRAGSGAQDVYRYDKHHLVPFGEFIPPLFRWFVRLMNIPLGDFNVAPLAQPSFDVAGQRLAPNICYEDLFGEELAARFTDAATAPTAFVNVSNIGWFGNTVAIDQHLQISRMRSLEFARPMIRATNTGATVVIDAQGRVTHALPRYTRGVLVAQAQGTTGLTPFAQWVSVLGLWPLWLLGALGVAAAAYAIRTSRPGRAGVT